MIARLGERLTALFKSVLPDPFIFALLLTLVTMALAWALTGHAPRSILGAWSRDPAWDKAFFGLLAFSMQMCLVLVTGHALAEAPAVKRLLRRIAQVPANTAQAAALVAFASMVAALLNWGLGLIVGAVLARETGLAARRRGIVVHYPIIGAAGYMGLMNWHGGLSGSGPLDLASRARDAIPITQTLLLPQNIVLNVLLLVAAPAILYLMAPRRPADCEEIPERLVPVPVPVPVPESSSRIGRLERSPALAMIFAALAAVVIVQGLRERGFAFVDLFLVPFAFLFLGLLLHASPIGYANAVGEAAGGCAGIILQFPFYAGIAGIMVTTGLGTKLAQGLTDLAMAARGIGIPPGIAFAEATFLAGALINMFIPSGGGQWKVQGAFAVSAGRALAPPVGENQTCMFIAYGDELTNMLQPFWALPLLGITGLRANQIMGYSAATMLLVLPIYLGCVAWMARS